MWETAEKVQNTRYKNYRYFIISVMLLMVVGGLMGIYLYFQTGNMLHTLSGAGYVILCIFLIDGIVSKIVYGGDKYGKNR